MQLSVRSTRRRARWWRFFGSLAFLWCALPAQSIRADEASGTWTGSIHADLNYFYEESTRVFMPTVGVKLEAPNGLRMNADYLLDVITSASIGAGRTQDEAHDERRHQHQTGLGKGFDLSDDVRLDLDATIRYSTESDYESRSGGLESALTFNEKNTVLRMSAARLVDDIRANSDPDFKGSLKAWSGTLGFEQVLNPWMVLTLGYQFGHLHGYLGNPYRFAQRERAPEREQPPRRRVRHGFSGRLSGYLPSFKLGVHALYRFYTDTWGVGAMAPELRLYREFSDLLLVRVRYRYYTQNRADFWRASYPSDWTGPISADPKLARFDSHTIGFRIELFTPFLSGSPFAFASNSVIYLQLDRVITGVRFGDQVTGTGGTLVRF